MIQDTSAMDQPLSSSGLRGRRWLFPGAAAGVLLLIVGFATPSVSRWLRTERSIDMSKVRVATVVRGDLEREVSVQGRIVAAFHPTTSSPAAGIVALKVRAGDVVDKDQVLAVVSSPQLASRLQQERSSLLALESELGRQRIQTRQQILSDRQGVDLARVELEAARRAMRRAEEIRAAGLLNAVEYEKAQDDLARSELALAHARESAELERESLELEIRNRELDVERQRLVVADLERQVADLAVRAPVAGLVSRLDVQDHDSVTTGQPLVAVVDLSAFEVEILVPEGYADEIGPGVAAVVSYSSQEYDGLVRSISPEVEGSQVRGIVSFGETSPDGLRQSQRVSTRLVLESKADVLKVRRGPFLESGGGHEAYVVDTGMAVRREIRSGATSVDEVEILSGLEEGDQIIISDTARFDGVSGVYLRD
jgi:HlyD family secretion protein